jgi:hypothetical protein
MPFDPVTLGTQTIEEHLFHKYTAPMTYDEFYQFQPIMGERHVSINPPLR